jgi:hypothetical protein
VQAHRVGGGVVEHEGQKIELQNGVETLGEFVKEGLEIALLGDGFADLEKRFELPVGVLEARGSLSDGWNFLLILHELQNSTRFGEVTTERQRQGKLGSAYAQGTAGSVWTKFAGAARRDILTGLQARSSVG